ncbi:hypothetical protein CIPAW_12G021400 [Carya illinoinensis]|uniref:Uncharacterized protein n=1 Tax=Carya illinoinensis TaxID=32201 RepID=A0A8T1NSJ6_CARIL|nr:hypothetical protein CIPAW_12G021400 [Carya illinoinensis]
MYWHISKGSWTFSMEDYGWQVSDVTGEGLKVMLQFCHDTYYTFALTNIRGPSWGKT